MALRIVVEGSGTIETALRWESVARLSASGWYSFTMPASDPAVAYLSALVKVYCYWDATLVGAGVVEQMTVSNGVLQVSGGDLASELLYKPIRYANSTSAETIANALGALVPSSWTYVDAITGSTNIVALNVLWDSLQSAVNTLCEMAGFWWHVVGNTLTIANSYGAVVAGLTPLKVTKRIDASNMVGVVFPFGAGDGMAALTAKAADLSLSAPYSYYQTTMGGSTAYGIGDSTSPGYPVTVRRRRLDFKHIAPPENTGPGIIAAANTLIVAGMEHLRQNATPVTQYEVESLWPGLVRPLDRVALLYMDESIKVSETLVATEVTTRVTPEALATVAMKLEGSARRILSDDEVIADALIASRITPVYQQLLVSGDTQFASVTVENVGGTLVEGAVQIRFQPDNTQVKTIVVRHGIVGVPADKYGNFSPPVPPSLEYRLNGTGSWVALGSTLDLYSALIDATTERQTNDVNTLNLRGVALTNYIKANAASIANYTTAIDIPTGTKLRLVSTRSVTQSGTTFYNYLLYTNHSATPSLATIAINDMVTVTGTKTTLMGALPYITFVEVTYKGLTGWIVVYAINPALTISGTSGWESTNYSARVDVSLQTRSVIQASA